MMALRPFGAQSQQLRRAVQLIRPLRSLKQFTAEQPAYKHIARGPFNTVGRQPSWLASQAHDG